MFYNVTLIGSVWDHKKADAFAPAFLRSPLSQPPAPPVGGFSAFGRAAEAALSLRSVPRLTGGLFACGPLSSPSRCGADAPSLRSIALAFDVRWQKRNYRRARWMRCMAHFVLVAGLQSRDGRVCGRGRPILFLRRIGPRDCRRKRSPVSLCGIKGVRQASSLRLFRVDDM